MSDDALKRVFVNGLKDEIQAEIRVIAPANLCQAMGAAQRVEDQNVLLVQVLLISDAREGREMLDSGEVTVAEVVAREEEATNISEETIELAALLVAEINPYRTFKIVGEILGHGVCILINNEANHNFISEALARKINLPIMATKNFGVTVGDGYQLKGTGICKNIKLKMQGIEVIQDFLPIKLGNIDVILGIEWLSRLQDVKTNWKLLTLKFRQNNKWLELQGDPTLTRLETSLKTLLKTV
ncbi:uncharacterized protein LOC123206809 [Mangifera indica]|uniref:uncharacterized protein LOC123206809 n=1 Tax=Mangifera indica TaxID=29780 RepID=UPI001CFA92BE|nr:uncharacterized protein LOC123206809 [Mangifera indica]